MTPERCQEWDMYFASAETDEEMEALRQLFDEELKSDPFYD